MFLLILLWDFSIYFLIDLQTRFTRFLSNNDETLLSIDKNELAKKLPGSCREIICFVIRDSTPVLAREMKCDIQSVKRDTPSI